MSPLAPTLASYFHACGPWTICQTAPASFIARGMPRDCTRAPVQSPCNVPRATQNPYIYHHEYMYAWLTYFDGPICHPPQTQLTEHLRSRKVYPSAWNEHRQGPGFDTVRRVDRAMHILNRGIMRWSQFGAPTAELPRYIRRKPARST